MVLKSLFLTLVLATPCSAQVFTVIVPTAQAREIPQFVHIDVPAGKIAEFINLMGDSVDLMLGESFLSQFRDPAVSAKNPFHPIILAGPLTVSVRSTSTYNRAICTYRLSDNVSSSAPSVETFTPSNSVVIPANANGNIQIILESSVDMVTWTAATPGTYSSATEKRFFRVRAVAP